ncbi:DUF2933 domain-containing protein [Streptomyces milbemycinicus]|uniref:DUF2933 domain-containing protein n=1 Tax=Streptomyces milbemycinicus TaxID=476552 RepID=A0ABW8LNM6_9ACTN
MNATNKRNYGLYAIALAIVVVGALALGASLDSLIWLALVAACPLMMFFMMRSIRGGHGPDAADRTPRTGRTSMTTTPVPGAPDRPGPGRTRRAPWPP